MEDISQYTRRKLLMITGSAAGATLAGCTDQTTGADAGTTATEDSHQDTHTTESSHQESETSHDDGHGHEETQTGHEDDGHDDSHEETQTGHEEEEGHGDHGHGGSIGTPTDSAEVSMVTQDGGYHFDPHVVRVNVGGTVTFHNESGSHSTTAYHPDNDQPQLVPDGAASWDSGLLSEAGATFEHTFETEGVYHYYCTPHEGLGMIGSVIVGEPDAHGQPALEEPPADKPEAVREKIAELNEMCNEALGHTH